MKSVRAQTRKFLSLINKDALERVARAATPPPRDHLLDATFSSIGSRLDPSRPPLSPTTRAPTLRLLGSGARRVAGGNDSRVALGGFRRWNRHFHQDLEIKTLPPQLSLISPPIVRADEHY